MVVQIRRNVRNRITYVKISFQMPPKCSFIQDDCVQIGAWWVELKDLNKVCWTYAKLKGVKKHLRKLQRRTCSRLSLWGLRGLVLSRLMSQWSLTGRSGLAGSPVTPRSPVRRGAPWLLPVGQHRGRDQQSEALWPGGAQGSCQWLCRQYGRVQVNQSGFRKLATSQSQVEGN